MQNRASFSRSQNAASTSLYSNVVAVLVSIMGFMGQIKLANMIQLGNFSPHHLGTLICFRQLLTGCVVADGITAAQEEQ